MAFAKTFLLSFLAPASVITPAALYAADSPAHTEFNEVVVTASRINQPISQVGVSVDVLNREDLMQRNSASLADILRSLPGISVSNSGGLGKTTSIFIRGEDAFRTRLYIDGIAVSDTTATQISPRFDALLNQQIGRVEVLKGPQALIYGADSGGVISVFTPEANEPLNADVNAETGSFATRNLSANLRGKNDTFDYFISSGVLDTAGFNARSDDKTADKDGFRAANIHIKARAQLSAAQSLSLVARSTQSANEYDSCYDSQYTRLDSCEDDTQANAARLNWAYTGEQLQQEFSLAHYINQHDRYLTAAADKNESVRGTSSDAQYFAHYTVNNEVGVSLGLAAKQETFLQKITTDSYRADEQRDSYGIFSEWLIRPTEQFSYSIGGRWDDSADFGDHSSYRLASAYIIPTAGPELKWRAAASSGFRSPSFYEIYFNNHSGYASPSAQTDFHDETSRGLETGLDAHWQTLSLSATLFSNKIQDEIFYDALNYSGYVQTEGESQSAGLEFSGQWQMSPQMQWRLGYTHLDTEQNSSYLAGSNAKTEKVQRPENSYSLALHLEFFAARWITDLNYRSAFNQRAYGGDLMEDYSVVDAQTAWQFSPSSRIYLRIANALEQHYQEVKGYNTAPLSAYAGLHWSY
jgi:vitamin B12 transporter